MRILQSELHRQLKEEAIATREKIAGLVRPLDPAQLNEHPEPNGWSVGQVLEHLIKGNEAYESPLAETIAGARPDAGAAAHEWKTSLVGGMIGGAILNPKPMKAPKIFVPGPTPRNGIVEEFMAREMKLVKTMEDAASLDWRAVRLRSPALPWWAPKMNLGDAFRILTVHATRHSHQIERIVGKL